LKTMTLTVISGGGVISGVSFYPPLSTSEVIALQFIRAG
jgi:hypothetical protein